MKLTVRARLTLLYTGFFVVLGAAMVVITFVVVPSLPGSLLPVQDPKDFLTHCREALNTTDEELRAKCDKAFEEGLLLAAWEEERDTTSALLLRYSLLGLAITAVIATLVGWLMAGRMLRPVHRITAAARTASEHDLSARVALSGPRDELRELADTFDGMLGRLEGSFRSQRLFIANASHELRTPLTVMRTAVDVVLAKPAPTESELVGMGREIRAAVGDAESLIDALLTLARNEHGLTTREDVDLVTVVEDATEEIEVESSLRPAVVSGDPVLLQRLVANLVDNAVRYNVIGGRIWVSTAVVEGRVVLTVANTGEVISPDAASALFEPFRRLHERTGRDGFGLGLTIVASIASVHDGAATVQPRAGGGLSVTVSLPAGSWGQ